MTNWVDYIKALKARGFTDHFVQQGENHRRVGRSYIHVGYMALNLMNVPTVQIRHIEGRHRGRRHCCQASAYRMDDVKLVAKTVERRSVVKGKTK